MTWHNGKYGGKLDLGKNKGLGTLIKDNLSLMCKLFTII